MEIQRYWEMIWKWLWLIIIGTAVAGGISFYLSQTMEPVYQATTTLVVHETANPIPGYEYSQPAVATHAELIEKESVMEEVVDELDLPYSPRALRGKISAHTNASTPLIKISAKDANPLMAQQIADTTVAVYIQQHRENLMAETQESLSYIESETATTKVKIDELEAKNNPGGLTPSEEEELAAFEARLIQLQSLRTLWEFQVLQAMAAGGISFGESASLPTSPVSPNVPRNVILACMLGVMVTTGGVFLKEWLDRSVKTAEDISKLTGLSTLGAVAKFKVPPQEKGGLIAEAHPRSSVSEAFRMLRTNLQFASLGKPVQTLLVTSAGPREGKTSVTANLAVSLAQMGKKVIAVDADLRRHQLHEFFELPNSIGFSNLLLAQQPDVAGFLQPTKVEGLKIITAGPHPHNPAELLGSPRMSFLIEELRKEADIILFDSAPVLAAADATIMAPKVDGTILVVESGHTKPEAFIESKEALSKGNVNILGVVLNRIELAQRGGYYYHYRYPYYYGYGYGYGYGEKDHDEKGERNTSVLTSLAVSIAEVWKKRGEKGAQAPSPIQPRKRRKRVTSAATSPAKKKWHKRLD